MNRLTTLEMFRRLELSWAKDPDSVFWKMAERTEEEIQAKLAAQEIKSPAPGEEAYVTLAEATLKWDRSTPLPLAFGVPDSARVYGSGYLARRPEMQEE